MKYAFDASAVLALLNAETGGEVVGKLLPEGAMSAVNAAEVGSRLVDAGMTPAAADEALALLDLPIIAFDAPAASQVARLRAGTRQAGLSLGDRACLALAIEEKAIAVTADRAWSDLDLPCDVQLIR